jgi:hypothetical protein
MLSVFPCSCQAGSVYRSGYLSAIRNSRCFRVLCDFYGNPKMNKSGNECPPVIDSKAAEVEWSIFITLRALIKAELAKVPAVPEQKSKRAATDWVRTDLDSSDDEVAQEGEEAEPEEKEEEEEDDDEDLYAHEAPIVIDGPEEPEDAKAERKEEKKEKKQAEIKQPESAKQKVLSMAEFIGAFVENKVQSGLCPEIAKLATIALSIPVSTAECERGFSQLSMIKTPARNRLSAKNLQSLMMIAIEGPPKEIFDFRAACLRWSSSGNRRIKLVF